MVGGSTDDDNDSHSYKRDDKKDGLYGNKFSAGHFEKRKQEKGTIL